MQVQRKRGRDVAKIGIKLCFNVECGCELHFEYKRSGSPMYLVAQLYLGCTKATVAGPI
jgi:hypothetical protein